MRLHAILRTILLGLATLASGNVNAVQLPSADQVLTENTLLLLSISDCENSLKRMKRSWFDNVYRNARKEGQLLGVETPALKLLFRQQKKDHHWLPDAFESIRHSDSDFANSFRKLVESFARDGYSANSPSESEVFECIASLFSGEAFVALEEDGQYFKIVFGFEYDDSVFDWEQELMLTSREQMADKFAIKKVGEVVVGHLPMEGLFFFKFGGAIYGVAEDEFEYTRELIEKLKQNSKRNKASSRQLVDSRRYQRVLRSSNQKDEQPDLFLYADLERLLLKKNRSKELVVVPKLSKQVLAVLGPQAKQPKGPQRKESSVRTSKDTLTWACGVGVTLRFDDKNRTHYLVCYPTITPHDKYVSRVLDKEFNVELDEDQLFVIPQTAKAVFCSPKVPSWDHVTVSSTRNPVSPTGLYQSNDIYTSLGAIAKKSNSDYACYFLYRLTDEVVENSSVFEKGEGLGGISFSADGFHNSNDLVDMVSRMLKGEGGKTFRAGLTKPGYVDNWVFSSGKTLGQQSESKKRQPAKIFKTIFLNQDVKAQLIGIDVPVIIAVFANDVVYLSPNFLLGVDDGEMKSCLKSLFTDSPKKLSMGGKFSILGSSKAAVKSVSFENSYFADTADDSCLVDLWQFLDHHQRSSKFGIGSFRLTKGSRREFGASFQQKELSLLFKIVQIPLSHFASVNGIASSSLQSEIGATMEVFQTVMAGEDDTLLFYGLIQEKD